MKKSITVILILIIAISMTSNFVSATNGDLITNLQMSLKEGENPNRLEVRFDLSEAIDLSEGESDIIFEYFTQDSNGNLEFTGYKKDRMWAGYLNSYDDYPLGENKYSSGVNNGNYSDEIPSATIYTSVKSGSSIDTARIAAVVVTVLRSDGSGNQNIVYSNISRLNENTGIKLETTAANLPVDTVLIADELTDGEIYETVSEVLTHVRNFVVFDIKLESNSQEIIPGSSVQLNIPIPQNFSGNKLRVYRVDNDGTRTPYTTTVTNISGMPYATFETDHFSTYVLSELETYPYTVEYYKNFVAQSNLIDTVIGDTQFIEGHQLTNEDIESDLGEAWLNAKKPATAYHNGVLQSGYPVISQITERNIIKILYAVRSSGVDYIPAPNSSNPVPTPELNEPSPTPDSSIAVLNHNSYIRGYDNNTIRPDENLTKAEAAMIFYRLSEKSAENSGDSRKIFSDVELDAWYSQAVAYLHNYGIMSGYEDMTYLPNNFITHEEMVKIMKTFYEFEFSASSTPQNNGNETFRPGSYVTRAEAIFLINKMLNRHVSAESILPNVHMWADVTKEHWAYADIMEATHFHTFTRENETAYEKWVDIHY